MGSESGGFHSEYQLEGPGRAERRRLGWHDEEDAP
jgi:hypothetical protein